MRPFTLGPIELSIVALEPERPPLGFLASLAAQVEAGTVRLVDLVVIDRALDGDVTISEVDLDELGLVGLGLSARGLAGYDDLCVLADWVPPGIRAAIIAFELTWARALDEQLARSGAVVIGTERIPAVVANTILDISAEE